MPLDQFISETLDALEQMLKKFFVEAAKPLRAILALVSTAIGERFKPANAGTIHLKPSVGRAGPHLNWRSAESMGE